MFRDDNPLFFVVAMAGTVAIIAAWAVAAGAVARSSGRVSRSDCPGNSLFVFAILTALFGYIFRNSELVFFVLPVGGTALVTAAWFFAQGHSAFPLFRHDLALVRRYNGSRHAYSRASSTRSATTSEHRWAADRRYRFRAAVTARFT